MRDESEVGFKAGDVVYLKSSYPDNPMTIERVNDNETCDCIFFSYKLAIKQIFYNTSLMKV